MRAHRLSQVETTRDAMERWVARVNKAADATLLPHAKHSWYLGARVPDKPRVFMPYAGGMARYRVICEDVVAKGYEGFVLQHWRTASLDLANRRATRRGDASKDVRLSPANTNGMTC